MNKQELCVKLHADTNHYYDKYLPYEFHLRMVAQVFRDFYHLLPFKDVYNSTREDFFEARETWYEVILTSCYAHDLIEDARQSYNDVKKNFGTNVADIVYAVTNEKGHNRSEKANDKYYEGIRNTPGAVFVKLCDRIANVQYGKLTKSSMFEKYGKENMNFMTKLGIEENIQLKPMFQHLTNLLIIEK